MTKAVKITQVCITINLLIAALIIIKMYGFRDLKGLITDFPLNFALGIVGLYFTGNFIAKKMDYLINVRQTNAVITGAIGLFLILFFGIFIGSTVGFLQKCIDGLGQDNVEEAAIDYYVKPFFWIVLFGFLPTLVTGSILGICIRKMNTATN
ncbi:hypothetical protein [Flavobacterium psychrotolerans]|uniref:Uncharacterized protein n=1 Tax=Flavobacterium psychrotolerans TaxID=2169410 RepID=A0A2U1JL51_9FLAO|nr:hypothetical protein [Flavobacterium psychrotolerans]PWA05897.1 hypothetical protein DB895_05605 [Flavobacterium psychrotolerans]